MRTQNLYRRGHLFWWRRKITVSGTRVVIALPLSTANFYHARAMAEQLGSALEKQRMAYSTNGKVVDPATLQKIFQDALRHQLDRIRQSQSAEGNSEIEHAAINSVFGEIWRYLAQNGPDACWSQEEEDRLVRSGWPKELAMQVAREIQGFGRHLVPQAQYQHYVDQFGYTQSAANNALVTRTILAARSRACELATAELGKLPFAPEAISNPTQAAPEDDEPLIDLPALQSSKATTQQSSTSRPNSSHQSEKNPSAPTTSPQNNIERRRISEAVERCIITYTKDETWSDTSITQVRTAFKLFTHACGGDIFVQDISKEHVVAFGKLCDELPNRWGRTSEEASGGIPASLAKAATMPREHLGISVQTKQKHITWIKSVLSHAALTSEGEHTPNDINAVEKAFNEQRRIGAGGVKKSDRKRARDVRSGWTKDEIARLLSAPIWTGSLSLDERFIPGNEVYHDAWYWLPLMFILYGGRSSELVGLSIKDVYENAEIPYFQINYTDLRRIKNIQSIRSLPIHPELIRLGFLEYLKNIRELNEIQLFPEMHSEKSKSFASTFYKSIFQHWRSWAYPKGTQWEHIEKGVKKDKDAHSFRHMATFMMKGKVSESVRSDILGHEGSNTTSKVYDEEANLMDKLKALEYLSPLTSHIIPTSIRMRPLERLKFGKKRGRRKKSSPVC